MNYRNHCPHCRMEYLKPIEFGEVEIDTCLKCSGLWFERHELGQVITDYDKAFPRSGKIVDTLGQRKGTTELKCPHCDDPMAEYQYDERIHLDLHLCETCFGIWLDHDQFDLVRNAHIGLEGYDATKAKPGLPQWLFQFFLQLPLEFNFKPRGLPVVTLALIGLNILVYVATLNANLNEVFFNFGNIPSDFGSFHWFWTLFSSQFIHFGFFHILGNMYFLYVLGDNVEDVMGRGRFLGFYLLGGVCAAVAQTAFSWGSDIPMGGASGAVAAVMGAYVVLFRKAYLTFMLVIFQLKIPAWGYLGVWFGFNILMAFSDAGDVAWWAHIGGFVFGAAVAFRWYRHFLNRNPVLRLINNRIHKPADDDAAKKAEAGAAAPSPKS